MNLILLDRTEIGAGDVVLSGARAAHLRRVLNVGIGQQVRVGMVDGPLGVATVVALRDDDATVALRCEFEREIPPAARVDLLLALPRPKVLRRLWAQLAAIGVRRIILTNAERVERDYWATHFLTPESYRPLLIEGLQQARDTRVPVVSLHRRFRVLVEDELDALTGTATRLVAHPGEPVAIEQVVGARTERIVVAVGPEGGWNAFELRLLEERGFTRVAIGERTLRTDTACIALLALTHAALNRRVV